MVCVTATVFYVNPAPVRVLMLPDRFTPKEMADTLLIAFGLDPAASFFEWSEGPFLKEDDERPLKEVFRLHEHATLLLTDGKHKDGLRIFAEATEQPDDMVGMTDEMHPLPVVLLAIGLQLPCGLYDPLKVSGVYSDLNTSKISKLTSDMIFYEDVLQYNEKTVVFHLTKRFRPEEAVKEINRNCSMPLAVLLGKNTMPELKTLCEIFRIYYDSTVRKPQMIENIVNKTSGQMLDELLDDLSLEEFLTFRKAILKEGRSEVTDEEALAMPMLRLTCMLSNMNKSGWIFARELLDKYDEIYATPREHENILNRHFRHALWACTALYGVFSREMLANVIKVILPEYREEELDGWLSQWTVYPSELLSVRTGTLMKDVYYNTQEYHKRDAAAVWKLFPRTPGSYMIPDRKTIQKLAQDGLYINDEEKDQWLRDCVSKYEYHYRKDEPSNYQSILFMLHRSESKENIIRQIDSYSFSPWNMSKKGDFLSLISNMVDEVYDHFPLAILGGYSRMDCPEHIKSRTAGCMK